MIVFTKKPPHFTEAYFSIWLFDYLFSKSWIAVWDILPPAVFILSFTNLFRKMETLFKINSCFKIHFLTIFLGCTYPRTLRLRFAWFRFWGSLQKIKFEVRKRLENDKNCLNKIICAVFTYRDRYQRKGKWGSILDFNWNEIQKWR